MIEFSKVVVEGFCSISYLDLQLNTDKITIIRAPNGAGKSSIFSAITWAIYGKNIKGISDVNTWKKYRTKDYKGTKVELFFNKDGITYKVIRCQNYLGDVDGSKGKNRLMLYTDATLVENKSKIQIQALLEQTLEMSYNLFLNSIMFGQGLKRIIQESGSDKKKVFEEIFELQYLTKARGLAYDRYNKTKSEVSSVSSHIALVKKSYEDLKNLSSNIDEENEKYLKKVSSKIEALEKEKKASAIELEKYRHNLGDSNKIDKNIIKTRQDIDSKRKSIQLSREKTNVNLKDLLEQVISILKKGNIAKALTVLKDIYSEFDKLNKYTDELSTLESKLHKLRDQKNTIDRANYKIKSISDRISSIDKSIRLLKQTKPKPKLKDAKSKLSAYKAELKKLSSEELVLTNSLNLYKWAYDGPLSNNGIKAFLFESSLGFLNSTLESYSNVLGFNIQFIVDLSSNRKDFETIIRKDGIDVFYEELSGGEKQLVNLAMAFAMNEVVNKSKGINIAFLDEIFESLSSDNIEVVVGLIKHIYRERSLFLITHQDSLPISNSKTLVVNKNHGLSYYE